MEVLKLIIYSIEFQLYSSSRLKVLFLLWASNWVQPALLGIELSAALELLADSGVLTIVRYVTSLTVT